jgi:hypothetical protein
MLKRAQFIRGKTDSSAGLSQSRDGALHTQMLPGPAEQNNNKKNSSQQVYSAYFMPHSALSTIRGAGIVGKGITNRKGLDISPFSTFFPMLFPSSLKDRLPDCTSTAQRGYGALYLRNRHHRSLRRREEVFKVEGGIPYSHRQE